MTSILTPTSPLEHELDADTSRCVIERALSAQVVVRLRPDEGDRAREVPARLVGADEATLALKLPERNVVLATVGPSTVLEGRFPLEGRCYLFSAQRVPPADRDPEAVLRVTHPRTVVLAERRRTARRRFRRQAKVDLRWADWGEGWQGAGEMLNLSVGGLACRVPAQAAEPAVVGGRLWVRFTAGGEGRSFELPGRICNVTSGGTAQHAILGVEFLEGTVLEATQPRLAAVIEERT